MYLTLCVLAFADLLILVRHVLNEGFEDVLLDVVLLAVCVGVSVLMINFCWITWLTMAVMFSMFAALALEI